MREDLFAEIYDLEEAYWWHVTKRRLVKTFLYLKYRNSLTYFPIIRYFFSNPKKKIRRRGNISYQDYFFTFFLFQIKTRTKANRININSKPGLKQIVVI